MKIRYLLDRIKIWKWKFITLENFCWASDRLYSRIEEKFLYYDEIRDKRSFINRSEIASTYDYIAASAYPVMKFIGLSLVKWCETRSKTIINLKFNVWTSKLYGVLFNFNIIKKEAFMLSYF